ncbi:hypothetical protein GCM10007049_22120 [Echinicola pacifica]|uniref:Histidine kinase domain-containing protein n=2 Tax=Echinicola pacifica TaxID=346377 RepID=A0A918Q0P7_9BACT|nr:hypothetical protein GCM10007049_22120 [Echinicola pacifica]
MVITGPSGIGKSHLLHKHLDAYADSFVLIEMNHLPQQVSLPYAGIKRGIGEYLRNLYKELPQAEFKRFSLALHQGLGAHLPLLYEYVPELNLLAESLEISVNPSPKVENQLYRLFRLLLEFFTDYFDKPLLLFTNNLQWTDRSGIKLLHFLLTSISPEKTLWLATCRDNKEDVERLNTLLERLEHQAKNIETLPLTGFGPSQSTQYLEEILEGPIAAELSQVLYETSLGNPSYMQVLVDSLKANGLLSRKNGTWQGEASKISAQYEGQNSQKVIYERFSNLESSTKTLLFWLACGGNPYLSQIKASEILGEEVLFPAIKEGIDSGLVLLENNNAIRFSENHLGELIYQQIPESDKSLLHYRIGIQLLDQPDPAVPSTLRSLAVQHLNQSRALFGEQRSIEELVRLNIEVAGSYKFDGAYEQARHSLQVAEDLMLKSPWTKFKNQSWQVALERARIEYQLGEYDLAEIYLDRILERPLDPSRRAEAFILKITINNHLGRYRKVITILKEALAELGLNIPDSEQELLQVIQSLSPTIHDYGIHRSVPSGVLSTDERMILRLLYVGGMALHHTSDTLMTWAASQIIIRAAKSATEGVMAIGYVSYGRMTIISGDIDKGFMLGQYGLTHNKSMNDQEYRCRVYGVYAFYISPWKQPFINSMPLLEEGMEAGRKVGDLIGLYILKTHLFNLHFIAGLPLGSLMEFTFEESYPGMELTYYITHYQKSLVKFLLGDSPYFAIPRQQPSWLAAKLTIQEERFYRNHVWARYYLLFGHYEQAFHCAEEANNNRKLQEGSPLVPANLSLLALSLTLNWHNIDEVRQKKHINSLQQLLDQLNRWRKHAPQNYRSAYYLLLAEWKRIHGEAQKEVEETYQKSIASADHSLSDRAMAHEAYARYLLAGGKIKPGLKALNTAIESYSEWEAHAKVRQLTLQFRGILAKNNHWNYPDIESIQRELSGDLQLSPLRQKLMNMLLRIAGADRVVLEWIENKGEVIDHQSKRLLSSMEYPDKYPAGLMMMCHRSQSPLIVSQLDTERGFSEVRQLQEKGVKSFLILPISLNSYLTMVIYLEYSLATIPMEGDLIRWITLTANQGGLIIENARTHEKTLLLNEEIRSEIAEKQALVTMVEKQKNSHLRDIIKTQEEERKRIAGELHDSLGSLLSTIRMQLQHAPNPEANFTSDTLGRMDEAIEEVRRIAHNMSPVSLTRFGLASALQTLTEQLNQSPQMEASLQVLGIQERLEEQLELTLYRICQELVQNVLKHAEATSIHLQIIRHPQSLNLTVEDNGKGMDMNSLSLGLGLEGIRAKVKMLEGEFDIESQPGRGCLAVIDIPISD